MSTKSPTLFPECLIQTRTGLEAPCCTVYFYDKNEIQSPYRQLIFYIDYENYRNEVEYVFVIVRLNYIDKKAPLMQPLTEISGCQTPTQPELNLMNRIGSLFLSPDYNNIGFHRALDDYVENHPYNETFISSIKLFQQIISASSDSSDPSYNCFNTLVYNPIRTYLQKYNTFLRSKSMEPITNDIRVCYTTRMAGAHELMFNYISSRPGYLRVNLTHFLNTGGSNNKKNYVLYNKRKYVVRKKQRRNYITVNKGMVYLSEIYGKYKKLY